jgi:hypothetical protein
LERTNIDDVKAINETSRILPISMNILNKIINIIEKDCKRNLMLEVIFVVVNSEGPRK